MIAPIHSWAVDRPISSPFATPTGLRGWMAGRFMFWTNSQNGVVDLLDVRAGDRVLEVGYGPGALLRLLDRHTPASAVLGVDPSATMRDLATRTNRAAVRAGRVRLTLGTADDTGLPDASADRVVSVNTVALWPDLDAGVAELRRVAAPAATVVLAWHGGTNPSRTGRRLRLPGNSLDQLHDSLAHHFGHVERRQTTTLDVFVARTDRTT
jgi:SAM-dependent methyltransferase